MEMNDVLTLISTTRGTDDCGDTTFSETSRTVFCEVMSIGQSEFYQAQAVGLKPELKFKLSDYLEYEGESSVEYDSVRYRVLRTYRTGNGIELVCYREAV